MSNWTTFLFLLGTITTTKSLNREEIASYDLTVTAIDHGEPPHIATAVVHISVNDLNDNKPIFSHSRQYQASVMEEQLPGDFVVKLIAFDLDSGENGKITYSFQSGKFYFLFFLYDSNGVSFNFHWKH